MAKIAPSGFTYTRTRTRLYNVHPSGAHMGALMGTHMHHPLGGALEPVTSRRRVDVRPRKEKK